MPEENTSQADQQQQTTDQAPPWGDDFNPEKAWNLIQGLRSDKEKLQSREVLTPELKQQVAQWQALEQASKTDLQRAQEETARWQADAQRWRETSVKSRVETLASADFADPSDAVSVLSDPNRYLGADGVINDDAIRSDLTTVLTQKPHWRRPNETSPRIPGPNRAQGTGGARAPASPADQFAAFLQGQISGR